MIDLRIKKTRKVNFFFLRYFEIVKKEYNLGGKVMIEKLFLELFIFIGKNL